MIASRPVPEAVIPAKAGIQCFSTTEGTAKALDPGFRRDDGLVRKLASLMLLLVMLFAIVPAIAQTATDPTPLRFQNTAEEQRFHALAAELRCVMCQNQSLADSNAMIAHDLRAEVLKLMREGRTDAQIKTFLAQRYGDFVLYKPRVDAKTWLLWFGPALLLLIGGFVVYRVVRGRGTGQAVPADDKQEW